MARMSIDDKVCRDPRITMLASLLGWSRRETVGCLILDVWPICYDQETAVISERVIDAAAAHVGFAQALIEAELASRDRSGRVRINGAKERIEYLNHKRRAGHEGGLKSAESRANRSKQTSSTGGSTPQPAGNPSAPDLPSASAPDLPSVLVPDPKSCASPSADAPAPLTLESPKPPRERKPKSATMAPGDYQTVVDAYHARYEAAYGHRPEWGAKQGAGLNRLLKSHQSAEVLRRLEILFSAPPDWMKPPFHFGTLVANFDALVQPSAPSKQSGRVEPKSADEYPEGEVSL